MANLWTTPWNFTSTDQAATAAISSIVRNGVRTATITTTLANSFALNQVISVQGQTGALFPWNGAYRIETIVSTTVFIVSIRDFQATLGNVGATGNLFSVAYWGNVIWVQQMLWDGATTGALLITDVTGDTVWAPATPAFSGTLTYMKAEPVNGLVLNTITSGTLQVSIH